MAEKTALVVGATGLVGKELVRLLLQSQQYKKIIIWTRRSLELTHPNLQEVLVSFDTLAHQAMPPVQDVFCTLGTTIKKAGSQEAFKKVDYEYPLLLGKKAKEINAHFFIVTAMGADAKSSIFYSRTKGEIEEALMALHLPSLHIFRPSLLIGDREEFRFGEKLAQKVFTFTPFFFIGPFKKYKPVTDQQVAQSMYDAAQTNHSGTHIYESIAMQR